LVELRLSDTLTAIGSHAFSGCSGLVDLRLPDTLMAIGSHAFDSCSGLVDLHLPSTLTAIGSHAFDSCSGLVDLHLPDTLRAIGKYAFCGCSGLVDLRLPDTLTAIGGDAFLKCTNLRCIVLPPALATLDSTAFKESTSNLRMLVVPFTVSVEIAAIVAATFGFRVGPNYSTNSADTKCGESDDVDFPNVSNLQLVSAPDAVVASLGGVFAEMTTMTEVRAAGRAVGGVVEHCFWSVTTHMHQVCSRGQRACAHTLLLVGARLYSQSLSTVLASDRSSHVAVREAVLQLPPLPDELWVLVLGWLRRSELDHRRFEISTICNYLVQSLCSNYFW
jgi:hypothetical protein